MVGSAGLDGEIGTSGVSAGNIATGDVPRTHYESLRSRRPARSFSGRRTERETMTVGEMETKHAEIVRRAYEAFRAEADTRPPMSLRGGNAVDGYDAPPPHDAALDEATGDYLERHHWGIAHLDAASWRHYLPRLVEHALAHVSDPASAATEAFLFSLRPPDRDPPRLGSLDHAQERVVADFLHSLAFGAGSAWSDDAMVALEEWWGPAPLYRPGR
jgi:hypothetical protein